MSGKRMGHTLGKRATVVTLVLCMLLTLVPALAAEEPKNSPTLTLTNQTYLSFQTAANDSKQYSLDQGSSWIDYQGSVTLTGQSQGGSIDVKSGTHDLVLDALTIHATNYYAMKIHPGATANLTLKNRNLLNTASFPTESCGIEVPVGATLRIGGDGELISVKSGMTTAAAIGSLAGEKCGVIEITGGTIEASDLDTFDMGPGPGIGSDADGTVYISGGSVNASITPRPTISAEKDIPVYRTGVELKNAANETKITDMTVDTKQSYIYGKSGLQTGGDYGDELYLWLPAGASTTSATDASNKVYQHGGPIITTADDAGVGTLISGEDMPKELIYLGGDGRNDTHNGSSPELAVATANKAIELIADGGKIVVCGDTTIPVAQTRIEGKKLSITNTDGIAVYEDAILRTRKLALLSDTTMTNLSWQDTDTNKQYSVGANVALILDGIKVITDVPEVPNQRPYFLVGATGATLTIRNSDFSGMVSYLCAFDTIELDNSTATALYTASLPNDASNFVLKSGSTLSVSKDIKSITSVGEGNRVEARKLVKIEGKNTLAPVTVFGPVSIESGKPITLTSFFEKTPKDCVPYLIEADSPLTLEKFTLNSTRFALIKHTNTLYAAERPVAYAPTDITSRAATLRATTTAIPTDTAELLWWKVGDEENKSALPIGTPSFNTTLSNLLPDTAYSYQARTKIGDTWLDSAPVAFRTLAEQATPPTGSIGGSVTNNTGTSCSITVTIEEGNTIRATQTLGSVSNGASAGFSFTALPDSFYNVVADNGAYKVTRLVEIKGGTAVVNVALALGKTQSVVEIITPDTPPAAVGGLPEQFEEAAAEENEGYTAADEAIVTGGGTVELKLTVERKEEVMVTDDAELIFKAAAGQTIPLYLDLSVIKTVIPISGPATEKKLVSVPKLLTVVLPLPDEAVGKQNITIYRVHHGAAEALPRVNPGENFEWVEIVNGNAILHVRQFSTYAVGYTQPASSNGNTVYPPIISSGVHGSIGVSPKSPSAGGKVTVTPKPDEGYLVDKVVVTDKNGKEITVKYSGDGTYTFTQPGGKVTVTVTFRPAWNPFEDVVEIDWFHDSVRYVYENKLMVGTSVTAFSPYWDTSRGMIITILWRIESEPGAINAASFPDIAPDQYYAEAVAWGAKKGIVKGYDNGDYGPDDPITREQLAAILWRYAQFKGWDVSAGETTNILSYPDFAQISEYAIPAIQWAAGAGIMNGKSGGTLDSRGTATRAEAATMLERFLKHIK